MYREGKRKDWRAKKLIKLDSVLVIAENKHTDTQTLGAVAH